MRIVNAELLIPTAEEIKRIVQLAYDTGRSRGREEAMLELRGIVDSPDEATRTAGKAGSTQAVPNPDTAVFRMFMGGKY